MIIEVTVDASGNVYRPQDEEKGKGKSKITWKLKTEGFKFTGLTFLDPQPPPGIFSNLVVKDDKMTIDDDNRGNKLTSFPYQVNVAPIGGGAARAMSATASFDVARAPVIRNVPT